MNRKRQSFFLLITVFLISVNTVQLVSQDTRDQRIRHLENELNLSISLFQQGEYEQCKAHLDKLIQEAQESGRYYSQLKYARIYRLRALVAYAFRDEAYKQEIRSLFLQALKLNPRIEAGNPGEVPPAVFTMFTDIKQEYLERFSKTTRRHSVGLFTAVVLEAAVFQDPSVLQPGVHYGYNISDSFTVATELVIPLWNSLTGQLGLIWQPSFEIETFSTGLSFYYHFNLDSLQTYTHSISLCGHMELIFRSGFGLAGDAEFVRIYQIMSAKNSQDTPSYNLLGLMEESLIKLAFANMSVLAFWTF